MENLIENASNDRTSNVGDDFVVDLRTKRRVESLEKERDCAVEMWNLAKETAESKKQDALKWETEANQIAKKMEDMQKDYTEAIKMLNCKINSLENELGKAISRNSELENIIEELNASVKISGKQSLEIQDLLAEQTNLKKSLEKSKEALQVSEKANAQAREKVADALAMAQDALANEASVTEEKARLEDALSEILNASETKVAKEAEKIKNDMESKMEILQTQEKNKLALECESIKAEYRVQNGHALEKNKSLFYELEELRAKRQTDITLWYEERDILRRQISTLQIDSENLLAQLKLRQMPCTDCHDQRLQVDHYRKLAKKWEETADNVTRNFEQYLKEAKEAYAKRSYCHGDS